MNYIELLNILVPSWNGWIIFAISANMTNSSWKTFKVLMVFRVHLFVLSMDRRANSTEHFDLSIARKYRSRYFAKCVVGHEIINEFSFIQWWMLKFRVALLTATKCSENTTDLLLHFVAAVAKVWYSASNWFPGSAGGSLRNNNDIDPVLVVRSSINMTY